MISANVQPRLVRFVDLALNDCGLDVPRVLAAWDKVAASPDLRLDGNPVELRGEVERLAWHAAAKGTPIDHD